MGQASPRGSERRGAGPAVGPSAQSNLPRAMRYFLALDSSAGKSSWEAAKLSILFFTDPSTYEAQLYDIFSGGSKMAVLSSPTGPIPSPPRVTPAAGLAHHGAWTHPCMHASHTCSRDLTLGWKTMLVLSRKERSRGWG